MGKYRQELRIDFSLIMSLALTLRLTRSIIAIPACFASAILALITAGIVPLPGNAIPIASQRQFIELAVYIPEQEQARDIINEKSIRNALACDMALGCSSNSVLHLLAISNEAGFPLDLKTINEISYCFAKAVH